MIRTMGKVKVVNIVRADMRLQTEGKGRQYSKYHNIGYVWRVMVVTVVVYMLTS